jgi:Family of unknown function (DUF5856)
MADNLVSDLPENFIATLLNAVTMAHFHHLMVNGVGSYAAHKALNEFYDEIGDLADSLAEAWQGCKSGRPLNFNTSNCYFSIGNNPLADIENLYTYVETKRSVMGIESHIQNTIDEICTLFSSTIYKLSRLS